MGYLLETDRLGLRFPQPEDVGAFASLFADREVMRFGDGPQERAWVVDWLNGWAGRSASQRESELGPLAIVLQTSHAVIGYCGLFRYPDVAGRLELEIGFRLQRAHWRQGYATEAATAVLRYARKSGHRRIIALIDPFNKASVAIARKLNMRHEADVTFPGYTHPDRVYAIYLDPPSPQP